MSESKEQAGNTGSMGRAGMARHGMEERGTLRALCLCGLLGMALDLDHVAAFAVDKHLFRVNDQGRFLHPLAALAGCAGLVFAGACVGGLYARQVLGHGNTEDNTTV